MVKKILFIPTYTYLSTPIFTRLLVELKEYETIYLDVEDQYQCEKISEQFKNKFTKSINLHINADSSTFTDKVIKFFKMVRFQKKLKKIIKYEDPIAIVTTGDLTFPIRIIKKYFPNIPIFVIQAGTITNKNLPRKISHKVKYIVFNKILQIPLMSRQNYFGNEYDDIYILLWGEYFKNLLDNNKNKFIVGNLTYDRFPIKRDLSIRNYILLKNNFNLDVKIVALCTMPLVDGLLEKEFSLDVNRLYKELIIAKPDILFIIKPHPRNNTKELKKYFTLLKQDNILICEKDLYYLFQFIDLHIASFSGTSLEALASEIPILSVNPNNEIPLQDFLNNELDEKVTNIDEMLFKIDKTLNSCNNFFALRDKYINQMLFKLDGNASKRAATIIKKEIKS